MERTDNEKCADISIAVFVAMHSSVRAVDHLTEVLKKHCPGTPLSKLHLKRTKCSSIILNVLEPVFMSELISEIGDKPYSILVDESTDVSSDKYMAYCIRYFNDELNDIVVDFLGLQVVTDTTAPVLYEAFKEFLRAHGLPYENLVGLGTDGASNLCAVNKKNENNSLWTLLRTDLPNLQLLKCMCHSLHKCSEKAMMELPSSLEFLLRESRNWFSHSSLRLAKYYQLYTSTYGSMPQKLVKLSDTRWLVFEAAVRTTLEQWEPLKTHFNDISNANSNEEKCYTARTLAAMFNNEEHLLYLQFLAPVLKQLSDMNKKFQASRADLVGVYAELRGLLILLARKIFKPVFMENRNPPSRSGTFSVDNHKEDLRRVKTALDQVNTEFGSSLLSLTDIDFGSNFETACNEMVASKKITKDVIRNVQHKCLNFLKKLLTEMVNRFPQNMEVISKLHAFNPYVSTDSGPLRPRACDLPWELKPPKCSKEDIEIQWDKLVTLRREDICGSNMIEDAVKFWSTVAKMKNAIGEEQFPDLAAFALRALSLPLSNAVVERVFSVMSVVKTKLRNRMKIPMLNAIMRTRLYLMVRDICCENFIPTRNMYQLHNSNMYQRSKSVRGSYNYVQVDRDLTEQEEGEMMDELITLYFDI